MVFVYCNIFSVHRMMKEKEKEKKDLLNMLSRL